MNVAALWRYPVKSLRGERLEHADVDEHGIEHDRHWGIVDAASGLVLTARRAPALLQATGRVGAVELPDGTVTSDDGVLSEWLGRPVTFVEANPETTGTYETQLDPEAPETAEWLRWQGPPGSFHDSTRTAVSLVSTGALGAWDERRFRPNVVLAGDGEEALLGRVVELGTVELDVRKQVDRCVVVARPQGGGLPVDLDVLRTVNRDRGGFLGVGALVRRPGRISLGDELRVAH